MRLYMLGLLLMVVLLACTEEDPVCSPPFILHNNQCCLDANNDTTCDTPSAESDTAFSCDLCPPKFVTEKVEVIVYKYVCMNGSAMDSQNDCEERIVSNAHLFTNINDEHDEEYIESFDARPACRGKYKAAEIHIKPVKAPRAITLQVMDEPDTVYRDLYLHNGSRQILDDEYLYIGFCEFDCEGVTDAQLAPDKAYLVRAELLTDGNRVRTREIVLDPTPEGEFSQQRC